MSFILDALKKSENDRQRQSGPALFEVRVPPPRSRFPLLAVAIVSLLVVNLGVVGWLMFRKPADAAVPQAQPAAAPQYQTAPPQVAQTPPPPPVTATAPAMAPSPGGYPQQAAGGYYSQPQGAPPPGYGQQQPAAPNSYGPPPNSGYQPQGQSGYAAGGGYPPTARASEPQLSDAGPEPNPEDYEPAREPAPGLFGLARATRSTASGLPTYEEAATRISLPPLHLDLHSYAPDPSKRFVLVNMRRLYEGQATPEGVKVESITTDAAIMSYQGTQFVLDRQ